ncbi:MAG TPA: MBL fold metallo-hydrolase [Opitutaceae bacterium]|nr:MBL fold metallo-hydrolase [Opitutaceae bacterium]
MQITLLGAAGEVTGSAYLVQTDRARVLVDFGMFQGRTLAGSTNTVPRQLAPAQVDAVVLTHAHLDHVGRLPLLAKRGYRGAVWSTPATLELARLILDDAARLQAQDAKRTNRHRERAGQSPVEPLFDETDVAAIAGRFRALSYERAVEVAPGVEVQAFESGHTLGSASLVLRADDAGARRTLVFSGDLGPRHAPILRDAACIAERADLVFLESTYGDRDHRSLASTVKEFRELVAHAAERGGKILVPTFAVGRAQQILYHLSEMFEDGAVRPFPVYLDSPMAIEATRLYGRHPELFDEEAARRADRGRFLKHLETVRTTVSPQESQALNAAPGPCLIMAGAGMCNAGRIVHHLRHNLAHPGTVVLIVGYQSPESLGRRLLEGAREVTIFGDRIRVRATVRGLGGFSAHAGQTDLLDWLACLAPHQPRVVLTHGEDEKGRGPLATKIAERFRLQAERPAYGDVLTL